MSPQRPFSEWWTNAWREACRLYPATTMSTVIGPLSLRVPSSAVAVLEWPNSALHDDTVMQPTATIAVTTTKPPAALATILRDATVLTTQGRGAFPLRYRPGNLWWAKWSNGPVVARCGDELLMYVESYSDVNRWLNRLLREVLIHVGAGRGFHLGHGAVTSSGGWGVLFCGDSGVGKTDAALKLASLLGAPVISVDRLLLGVQKGLVVAGSLPFGLNVHLRTLDALGVEVHDVLRTHRPVNEKVYLKVRTAERILGALKHQGVIDRLVKLDCLDRGPDDLAETKLEAAQALTDATSQAEDPAYRVDWLGLARGTPNPVEWSTGRVQAIQMLYRPGTAQGQAVLTRLRSREGRLTTNRL